MGAYHVRVGTASSEPPAEIPELYDLPYREAEDDGKIIVSGGLVPVCPDCGRGHLQWAEGCFVAWHRICDVCGSHWELHTVEYIDHGQAAAGPAGVPPSLREQLPCWHRLVDGRSIPIAEADPDESLPDGITHARLLQLGVEHGTEPNRGPTATVGNQIATACWCQRARFNR